MKKVFLFLAVSALTFTSCTKDDKNDAASGSMGKLTFTMDGVTKTFNKVVAVNSPQGLMVTAYPGSSPSDMAENVNFIVKADKTGTDAMIAEMGFTYVASGVGYEDGADFVLNVSTNSTSAKTLKGTFTGTLEDAMGDGADKTVKDGTFDIKYQ
jgi:hypothetical protein